MQIIISTIGICRDSSPLSKPEEPMMRCWLPIFTTDSKLFLHVRLFPSSLFLSLRHSLCIAFHLLLCTYLGCVPITAFGYRTACQPPHNLHTQPRADDLSFAY